MTICCWHSLPLPYLLRAQDFGYGPQKIFLAIGEIHPITAQQQDRRFSRAPAIMVGCVMSLIPMLSMLSLVMSPM